MRLFIGIPLAPEVIDALTRTMDRLRSPGDGLRWTTAETWHITLQFLGETPTQQFDCAMQRLGEIQAPHVPVWLDGIGFFDRAGVFFAGVKVSPELRHLQKQVVVATSHCGFVSEDLPYQPHVTLARTKGDNRMQALRELKTKAGASAQFPAFTATEFLLYEAFLSPGGSRYEVRGCFPLAAEG